MVVGGWRGGSDTRSHVTTPLRWPQLPGIPSSFHLCINYPDAPLALPLGAKPGTRLHLGLALISD